MTYYNTQFSIILAHDTSDYEIGAVLRLKLIRDNKNAVCHVFLALKKVDKHRQMENERLTLKFVINDCQE